MNRFCTSRRIGEIMMAYVKFLLPLIFIASLSVTDLKEPTAALVNLEYKSTPIIEKKLTSNSTCWNSYCKLTGRAEDVAPYCIVDLLARISLLFLKKLGLRSHWLLSNAWESGSTAWTASLPLPRLKKCLGSLKCVCSGTRINFAAMAWL